MFSVQIIVSEAASESVSISKPWRPIEISSFCQRCSTQSSLLLVWRHHSLRKMEKSVWSLCQNKIWCVSRWVNEVEMHIQIKSNHFYCHITTAQVPWWVKFLWACSRQCKKQQTIYLWTDSAKKQQTIYLWTDSAKNNKQFTYGQTVQKTTNNLPMDRQCKKTTNNLHMDRQCKKTALEHLQCSRQCKKKKNNSNLHMDRQCKKNNSNLHMDRQCKKQQQFTYGQYIFTDCTEDNVQNTHTYTQYA